MDNVSTRLADEIRQQVIALSRLSTGQKQKIERVLRQTLKDLSKKIIYDLPASATEASYQRKLKRLTDLMVLISKTIDDMYKGINSAHNDYMEELYTTQANWATKAFNRTIGVKIFDDIPITAAQLKAVTESLVFGVKTQDFWVRQSIKLQWNFQDSIRLGIVQGETNEQLFKRLTEAIDAKGNPVLDIAKGSVRGAEALIRTTTQTVANRALSEVYRQNEDILNGVQWVSTLDDRTTPECIARDGLCWDMDGNPVGHTIEYEEPPIHWNCRSVLVPWVKSFKELGIEGLGDLPPSTRASMDGQVSETVNFGTWLKGKEAEKPGYADNLLGKGRADLWRKGLITTRDLVDQKGRPYTLAELRSKTGQS